MLPPQVITPLGGRGLLSSLLNPNKIYPAYVLPYTTALITVQFLFLAEDAIAHQVPTDVHARRAPSRHDQTFP